MKFGFKNGCYWRIFSTIEEAKGTWQSKEDYVKNSIAKGLCLLINPKGGYHCDSVDDLSDVHEADSYPEMEDRLVVLSEN